MTGVSIDELIVFAGYRRRRSNGPVTRGAQRVLDLAPGCATLAELLARLSHDDAVVTSRWTRDAGLPLDPETEHLASTACLKESFLAGLVIDAEIRDAITGLVERLNAVDEADRKPPFSWLGRD